MGASPENSETARFGRFRISRAASVFSPWRRIGPGCPSSRSSSCTARRSPTCGPHWRRLPALGPLLSTVMIAVDEEYAPMTHRSPRARGWPSSHRSVAGQGAGYAHPACVTPATEACPTMIEITLNRSITRPSPNVCGPAGGGRLHVSGNGARDHRRSPDGLAGLRSVSGDGPQEAGGARGRKRAGAGR